MIRLLISALFVFAGVVVFAQDDVTTQRDNSPNAQSFVPSTDAKSRARDSYEAFLELAPQDDPRRPGALRRLADMELEAAEELLIDGARDAQGSGLFS